VKGQARWEVTCLKRGFDPAAGKGE
jgi:hypothetical protein